MWAVSKPPLILPVPAARRPARGFTRTAIAANVGTSSNSPAEEISGSDVLRALQRAAAAKKKRNQSSTAKKTMTGRKTRRFGEAGDEDEEETSVRREARPFRIDRDWGRRLDDLEDRLLQLSRLM